MAIEGVHLERFPNNVVWEYLAIVQTQPKWWGHELRGPVPTMHKETQGP